MSTGWADRVSSWFVVVPCRQFCHSAVWACNETTTFEHTCLLLHVQLNATATFDPRQPSAVPPIPTAYNCYRSVSSSIVTSNFWFCLFFFAVTRSVVISNNLLHVDFCHVCLQSLCQNSSETLTEVTGITRSWQVKLRRGKVWTQHKHNTMQRWVTVILILILIVVLEIAGLASLFACWLEINGIINPNPNCAFHN